MGDFRIENGASQGSGTVTSVSIDASNGVSGTVTNGNTTPSLKLKVVDLLIYTYFGGF